MRMTGVFNFIHLTPGPLLRKRKVDKAVFTQQHVLGDESRTAKNTHVAKSV